MTHPRKNDGRRDDDKCLVKRLYAIATPYVQMGGWLVLAITAISSTIILVGKAEAFDRRLSSVEQAQMNYGEQLGTVNTKLDTVIYFVRKR